MTEIVVADRPSNGASGTAGQGSGEDKIDRKVLAIAGVVIVGAIMAILDITIVNVALDRLAREFDASLATIQWVVTGYTLALVAVIPLTGWAADRFGTKRLYMAAVTLFVIGSGLTGAAQSIETLIAFRVLQGLGGGMIMPLVLTMLTRAAGPTRVGRVMSVIGVPMLLGPICGPILGGWLVDEVSWRWIFYINLPVGLVGLALAALVLPRDEHEPTQHLDVIGLLLLSPGLAAFVYGAAEAASHGGFDSPQVYLPGGVGLALVVVFVVRSLLIKHPLIDLRLFRNRTFSAAALTMLLFMIAFFGALLMLPLYFQTMRRESALDAGLLMAPQGIGAMLTMPLAGRFTDRVGAGRIVLPGMVVVVVAMSFFTQIGADTSYWLVCAALFVAGLGLGMTMMPIMSAAMATLSHAAVARASTTMNIVQQTGASIGTAMLSVVLATELADRLPGGDTAEGGGLGAAQAVDAEDLDRLGPLMADAFGFTFAVAVVLLAAAVLPALLLPRRGADVRSAPGEALPAVAAATVAVPAEDLTPVTPTAPHARTGTAGVTVRGAPTRADGEAPTPVGGAAVALIDASGAVRGRGVTDPGGTFTAEVLPPGRYTVAVSAPGHLPRAVTLGVNGWGPARCNLDLARAAQIRGRVHGGTAGWPLADARVIVRRPDGALVATAVTAADGSYLVEGLERGEYLVTVTGYPAHTDTLAVGGDAEHEVTLLHDPPAALPAPDFRRRDVAGDTGATRSSPTTAAR